MFSLQPQPLKLNNVDEHVLHEIDDALQVDIDKEEILRKVRLDWNVSGLPSNSSRIHGIFFLLLICRCF